MKKILLLLAIMFLILSLAIIPFVKKCSGTGDQFRQCIFHDLNEELKKGKSITIQQEFEENGTEPIYTRYTIN